MRKRSEDAEDKEGTQCYYGMKVHIDNDKGQDLSSSEDYRHLKPAAQPMLFRHLDHSSSPDSPRGISRICLRPSLISNSSPGWRSRIAV